MVRPQQEELARSDRTDLDPDHARARIEGRKRKPTDTRNTGPVPEENQPGHHPEDEQDQPDLG